METTNVEELAYNLNAVDQKNSHCYKMKPVAKYINKLHNEDQ